jgi:hypothetical protein
MNRESNTTVVVLVLAVSVALAGVGVALLLSTESPVSATADGQSGWFGNARAEAERQKIRAEEAALQAAAERAKRDEERRHAEAAAKEAGKLNDVPPKESERPAPKRAANRTAEEEQAAERFRDSTIAREAVAREGRRRMMLANRSIPSGRFNPAMCAEKSAADFERSFFGDAPSAKESIAFVDVSTADGSLIVHFTQEAEKWPDAQRKAAGEVVVQAWRESKFTQLLGFSKTVEFRGSDRVLYTDEQ